MIADFKHGIDKINALADNSLEFIWRLKEEGPYATNSSYKIMEDEKIIFTLSVWKG